MPLLAMIYLRFMMMIGWEQQIKKKTTAAGRYSQSSCWLLRKPSHSLRRKGKNSSMKKTAMIKPGNVGNESGWIRLGNVIFFYRSKISKRRVHFLVHRNAIDVEPIRESI